MAKMNVVWTRTGAILCFLAVALGAFGAHGLEPLLEQNSAVDTWQTAATYHLFHGLAMLFPQAAGAKKGSPALFFCAGIVLFSGSLYLLSVTGIKMLGMITPFGGLCFLIGWGRMAWCAGKEK